MPEHEHLDFIRQIVADDVAAGTHGGRVLTRFPPEPNGFLHIGHGSAICLDFGVASEYGGRTTLRMDDTNPTTEDPAYVEAICRDIQWLGFEWEGEVRYASDYFEALYRMALRMVEDGFAYVDSLLEAEIREYRGTVREPSRASPYRKRSVDENLDLFRRMRAGEFGDGEHVLRARLDLAAPNMKMRDPLMYRIRHAHHYRTGDEWPIYPFYDWAHGQSDAIEGITHSICTLEFQANRELYDWFLDHTRPAAAGIDEIPGAEGGGGEELGSWSPRPRQYEFARRNLDYTIVSKRKLLRLVADGHVAGWDDPRMPTLAGLRRRGVPPEAVRVFCDQIGIGKAANRVDIGTLEWAVRDALNPRAPRVMCVLDPLRVVIDNYPDDAIEWLEAPYFPPDIENPPEEWPATRRVPFSANLYIEREDFAEDPPSGFRRLAPGREVRLRHGFFLTCQDVVKDDSGQVIELRCTYDPDTLGGSAPDGRKPSGTIHWVSADAALPAVIRVYDRLFKVPDPDAGVDDFCHNLNPRSLETSSAWIEPSVSGDPPGTAYQFERLGYFVRDRASQSVAKVTGAHGDSVKAAGTSSASDSEEEAERAGHTGAADLVFNRTVPLRDTWAKQASLMAGTRAGDSPGTGRGRKKAEAPIGAPGPDSGREERDRRRAAAPSLKAAFERFSGELGLPDELADLLSGSERSVSFYEATVAAGGDRVAAANWLVHEVRGAEPADAGESRLEPQALASLVTLVEDGTVSRAVAKDLLGRLIESGGDPRALVESEGLGRIADTAQIREMVERIMAEYPEQAERFQAGQAGLAGFFVGQVMRESGNRADPAVVRELVQGSLR